MTIVIYDRDDYTECARKLQDSYVTISRRTLLRHIVLEFRLREIDDPAAIVYCSFI